ncbi:MAG: hypothetical protein ACLVHS_00225 [Blautia wexlerae]
MELIELPEDYKKCSSGGEAVVRQNNGSYTVGFWYTQGFWTVDFLYLHIVRMKAGQM